MVNDPRLDELLESGVGFTFFSAGDGVARNEPMPTSPEGWESAATADQIKHTVKRAPLLTGAGGPWGGNRWQSDLDRLARRRADFVPVNRRPGYAGVNPADIFANPVPKSLRLSSPFANPWVDNMDKVFLDLDEDVEGDDYDPYLDPAAWRSDAGQGRGAAAADYTYHGTADLDA